MGKTVLKINNGKFSINNEYVYSEYPNAVENMYGLLMNARFIQGIYDDPGNYDSYNRFGGSFHPDKNTDDLIAALPEWYAAGLRAFTVGIQGGGCCYTMYNVPVNNNPYSEDGCTIDSNYLDRLDRIIKAADRLGMIIIVSYFYGVQAKNLKDEETHRNAVKAASAFLKNNAYTNVIIEIANEYNIPSFDGSPVFRNEDSICTLIQLAKEFSGGMYVGVSGIGGTLSEKICSSSDIILIHGNTCTRQQLYNIIKLAKKWQPGKPILCNEDSQCLSNCEISVKEGVSWGYYNNMTKQELPINWRIGYGEDSFFAQTMQKLLGIETTQQDDKYVLMGLKKEECVENKRWVRVATLNPLLVDYVDFFCNDFLVYTCYDEPFTVNFDCNWRQYEFISKTGDNWTACVYLRNGEKVTLSGISE